jgi:hypothetical protein
MYTVYVYVLYCRYVCTVFAVIAVLNFKPYNSSNVIAGTLRTTVLVGKMA